MRCIESLLAVPRRPLPMDRRCCGYHSGGALAITAQRSVHTSDRHQEAHWLTRASPAIGGVCFGTHRLRQRPSLRRAKDKRDEVNKKSGSTGLDGLKKWVEEKKAQGTGGAGGAVVGGMIAGPLGAMVGATLGSKVGPTVGKLMGKVDETLKELDEEDGSSGDVVKDVEKSKDAGKRGNSSDGVKQWVDEKKSQGTGGVGGAVMGGMVAGPLGAVVGAAVGSKIGKALTNADSADRSDDRSELAERDVNDTFTQSKLSTSDPISASVKSFQGSEGVADSVAQTSGTRGHVASLKRVKAAQQALDRTVVIFEKTAERCKAMESELQELYSKAELKLAAGDDETARALLASRAKVEAELTKVQQLQEDAAILRRRQEEELRSMGGPGPQDPSPMSEELDMLKLKMQAKKSQVEDHSQQAAAPADELASLQQSLEARRQTLKADAEKLYEKAENALRAGDEQGARTFLAEYQDLKLKLKNLGDSSDSQAV